MSFDFVDDGDVENQTVVVEIKYRIPGTVTRRIITEWPVSLLPGEHFRHVAKILRSAADEVEEKSI